MIGASVGTDTRGAPTRLEATTRRLLVEQRQLAELVELQDVVPEDRRLLPLLEAGVLKLRGQRLEDFGVAGDIPADFLGGPGGDVPDCRRRRIRACRAAARRSRRGRSRQRHDRGQRQNQRELAADAAESEAGHGQLGPVGRVIGGRPPRAQRGEDVAARLDWDFEPSADRPCPFAPRQEDRGWIVDDGVAERRRRRPCIRHRRRVLNRGERGVDRLAASSARNCEDPLECQNRYGRTSGPLATSIKAASKFPVFSRSQSLVRGQRVRVTIRRPTARSCCSSASARRSCVLST